MPWLSRTLIEHQLPTKANVRPIRQSPQRFSPKIASKLKEEIQRLLKGKFIRLARYAYWISNIVPILKKNGKLRICIDFRNLNNATPKDEYPMHITDMLVDSASGHKILSFLDRYYGYNQIYIVEDVSKTTFRCPSAIGTYEWVVMPFGLKNARATY